jgi:hypothetical protein
MTAAPALAILAALLVLLAVTLGPAVADLLATAGEVAR